MTSPSEPKPGAKPDPLAALIVYGHAGDAGSHQASWFKAADKEAVQAAAKPLGLTVLELQTDAEKALAIGAPEGVLKSSGRMIVGSVSPEIYRRIEAHAKAAIGGVAKSEPEHAPVIPPKPPANLGSIGAAPQPSPSQPPPLATQTAAANLPAAPALPSPVPASRPSPAGPTMPWDALHAGSLVLAAYWTEKDEIEGWWPAVVTSADATGLVLKWRDAAEYALGPVEKKYIAILHPDLLASGE